MKIKFDSREAHFADLAENIHQLNQQAVREYAPIVDAILRSRSQDKHHIEYTLDGLLDFCGYEPALQLYHSLCRHYWNIAPDDTAFYVEAYRAMWDSEKVEMRIKNASPQMELNEKRWGQYKCLPTPFALSSSNNSRPSRTLNNPSIF